MERNFQVVDLVDSTTHKFLGQALFCAERTECPYFAINDRIVTGELFEAFSTGAKEMDGTINLYHINMPVVIDSNITPYNEIRNTVVKEMQIRSERGDSYKEGQ